ncbi:nucleoside triphosphate pyrophosphohydrolase [Paenibacillus flagellatus]|uniref:Nucleoside triphosphate pyrophosphohydrolase n=1 Tax=Paenibacillus flagellatus TaxID=2211139 RepID=A0A2V5KP48_9BACL|nr:nucleoside triphosphate pyrophosphohydrolase [Paenibacillus flagellatus]PYI50226.1 nucleoside triphosphate pyrophosphohydrolase [Paenibacillus flagellatus]
MPSTLTVVGLGSGDENQLTLGVWNRLREAGTVYARTENHPVVDYLKRNGVSVRSFDHLYEAHGTFGGVYAAIVDELLRLARESESPIVYAVPGHPMVAESTTKLLRERCSQEGLELSVVGGESFLDQAFARFGFDPIEGVALFDATDLPAAGAGLEPRRHALIAQVYDTHTASDAKLFLMNVYPDDYEVVVGHELGVAARERIVRVPLYELDRLDGYGNLSLVWVPSTTDDAVRNRTFERLREIVDILRSPEGCPWDREQTHASIRKNLIEETYEVLETIDDDDPDAMCEELGDLLLQIMLHSQMEAETGAFDVHDVIAGLNEKLVRRHPHVFGERGAEDADEALRNWNAVKADEKRSKGVDPEKQSVLAGVPRDLPGLMKAYKLQKKAAQVGFDWERQDEVFAKIEEELAELREAGEDERMDELGDLLFAVVNLARFMKIDPEEAIASTNRKFVERFAHIENRLREQGKSFEQAGLSEMELLWQEAKKLSKNARS